MKLSPKLQEKCNNCPIYKSPKSCITLHYINENIPKDKLYSNMDSDYIFVVGIYRETGVVSILNSNSDCQYYTQHVLKRLGTFRPKGKMRPANFIDKRKGIKGLIEYVKKSQAVEHTKNISKDKILKDILLKRTDKLELSEIDLISEELGEDLKDDEKFAIEESLLMRI
jgi:hypothetical protein